MFESARAQLWLRRAFFVCAALAFVMALIPPPDIPGEPGDKIQHMMAFFTLGAIASAGWRDRTAVRLFSWLAAFGAAIELFQSIPVLHRDAELLDWLADMAAAAVALGLVRLVLPGIANASSRDRNGSDA
jgi:VanZ family protein